MITLDELDEGEKGVIVPFSIDKDVRLQLIKIGLYPGKNFEVILNRGQLPIIIGIEDSRYFLERNYSTRIYVNPQD